MKFLIPLSSLFLLGAASPTQKEDLPPAKFTGDGISIVVFTSDVRSFCGEQIQPGMPAGCFRNTNGRPVIVLPNPCLFPEDDYASWACHEKAHQHGWAWNHPRD